MPDYDQINPEYLQGARRQDGRISPSSASCLSSRWRAATPARPGRNTMTGRLPMCATSSTSSRVPGAQRHFQPDPLRLLPEDHSRARLQRGLQRVIERYGRPPFGTLLSANANPSTLANFGDEGRWLDVHQTGNTREHYSYWWMTDIYRSQPRQAGARRASPTTPGFIRSRDAYATRQDRATRRRTTCTSAPACMAACSRAAMPATSTARRAFGSRRSSRDRASSCGMPSSGAPAETVRHLRTFAFVRGDRLPAPRPCSDALVGGPQGPRDGL